MSNLEYARPKTNLIEETYRNAQSTNDFTSNSSLDKKKAQNSFLDRNYTSQLHKCEHKTFKLITENELHSILFTLKKYYNTISKENEKAKLELKDTKKTNKELIHKEQELRNAKEFSVNQKEKIIVLNARENTDYIKATITKLDTDLNDIKSRHKFEEEYTSTVNHMIEGDKLQLMKINEAITIIEEKLKDISKAHRVLKENTVQKDIILQNYDKCLSTIDHQIEDVEKVLETQDSKQRKIDQSTQRKEGRVEKLKQVLHNKTTIKKEEIEIYKSDMIQQLDEYRFKKDQLVKRETKFIDLILGMNIIKKYFIDNNNKDIDLRALKESEDYKVFCSNQYQIINSNEEIMMTTQSTRLSMGSSSKVRRAKIRMEDLKIILNSLDMTYDDLYNYLLKIKTKGKFTRDQMISLNEKAITFENKKMMFTQKVNEIIEKDYKNFDDLIKLNSRFEKFIQSNNKRLQIEKKAKKQHEHSTYFLINSFLNENHVHPDIKEIKQNAIKFLAQSRAMLINIKAYLEDINNSFIKCKYFRDYDEINISSNITPVGKKYNLSTVPFLRSDITQKKEYLFKLVNYSINKFSNEDAIYIKNLINDQSNLKQILDSDWIMESEIFEFYNSIDHMKTIVKILENLIEFYAKNVNDYENQHNKIRNSISNPLGSNKIFFNHKGIEKKIVHIEINNNSSAQKNKREHRNTKDYPASAMNERYHTHYNSDSGNNDLQSELDDSFNENNKKPNQKRPSTSNYIYRSSISRKLYEPSLQKNQYVRALNEGLDSIRQNTLRYKRGEFRMNKKWNEMKIIKREFFPYNNPRKLYI